MWLPSWVIDRDGRRALEPMPLNVPAGAIEHAVAGGGERGEVGHGRAGHEPDARRRGQVEQLDEPGGGDLFGDGRCRRQHVQAGVLVPGARQPVGPDRRRDAAADDEPEITRAGASDEARLGRRRRGPR